MPSATVTSKGQITIPVDVRAELELQAGDQVDFVRNPRGNFELAPRKGSIQRLKGILHGRRPTISIEEINLAIAERASKQR
jgi:antitoxin PrlF